MTGCWQPEINVVICPEMVDSPRICPGFTQVLGENHEEQKVWVCTDRTHGFFSPPYWDLPQECMLSVKKYYPTSWSWRWLFLSVITRPTLTVVVLMSMPSWQPSIFHHFSVFRGSFGKIWVVSCLFFPLFARLCTRTELNSGLCCAADCIGDGSALGAASFWSLPSHFLVNSLNYHLVMNNSLPWKDPPCY